MKKYFQPVDPKTKKAKKGFVVPVRENGQLKFLSLDNGKEFDHFMTVFTGVDLTPQIVFSKMVDNGFSSYARSTLGGWPTQYISILASALSCWALLAYASRNRRVSRPNPGAATA